MKTTQDILTSLQHKPQFKKIIHHKCIDKLLSTILPALRRNIKHGYINKNIFYIIITAALNKYDKDNIIKTIKGVLNSPMILKSERFMECNEINIEDVIVYVDHKPNIMSDLHTTSTHKIMYTERASGDIKININDAKLHALAKSIQEIIKKEHNESS
ncbi:hypothetical protein JHD49_04565 [Sulfurimonas sp. SAG-AH-194-C21]|nr:hypothetical protein [Sulfurimonas sp. SAG-AH-194-C21]MDF1883205.1 hypothetical protein [Sulfurimonas sp. SAG-AH-194-C21]